MEKKDIELTTKAIVSLFFIVILIIISLNAGNISRFWATVGQDKIVTKDVVYQANGVRVYHFKHDNNDCYLADDPKGGASIFCIKE